MKRTTGLLGVVTVAVSFGLLIPTATMAARGPSGGYRGGVSIGYRGGYRGASFFGYYGGYRGGYYGGYRGGYYGGYRGGYYGGYPRYRHSGGGFSYGLSLAYVYGGLPYDYYSAPPVYYYSPPPFVYSSPPSVVYSAPPTYPAVAPSSKSGESANPARPMGPADVKALAKSGVSDEVIISQIRGSRATFRLSTAEIIDMKDNGVSEKVIDFMINTATR